MDIYCDLPLELVIDIAKKDINTWKHYASKNSYYHAEFNTDSMKKLFVNTFTREVILRDRIEYKLDGRLHRDDGLPAVVWHNGLREWYQYGEHHSWNDLPAIIRPDGTQEWYHHDKLHRDDGPAVIRPDGTREWYYHDSLKKIALSVRPG